jgi:hypothetical protein
MVSVADLEFYPVSQKKRRGNNVGAVTINSQN